MNTERDVKIVCSACLTEACAQAVQMCAEARRASFLLIHARHEEQCPVCHTANHILRKVIEAVCCRDGITLESDIDPGYPARNYELAERLGISEAFGSAEEPHETGTTDQRPPA